MKQLTMIINSYEAMIELGSIIGSIVEPNFVIALNGDLGAGKTTLTKGIGRALAIDDTINSPTFTIMKVYYGRLTLYHLDVYRIENSESDFDLEEYFYLDGVSVIEWADNIKNLLPANTIKIDITIVSEDSRKISITTDQEVWLTKLQESWEKANGLGIH